MAALTPPSSPSIGIWLGPFAFPYPSSLVSTTRTSRFGGFGVKQAVEVLENTLDAAANKQFPYPEMLAELLGAEVAVRRERNLAIKTRMAHLPFRRTLERFGFAFQPSVDERLVKELANLAFVAEATNVLLLGPPGVARPTWPSP